MCFGFFLISMFTWILILCYDKKYAYSGCHVHEDCFAMTCGQIVNCLQLVIKTDKQAKQCKIGYKCRRYMR